MSADIQRQSSTSPKTASFPRRESRQVKAIDKDYGDGNDQTSDVEAQSQLGVIKPLRRRMSSKHRTREVSPEGRVPIGFLSFYSHL